MSKIIEHQSNILFTKNLNPSVKHIFLEVPEAFEFEPGQFINIEIPSERRKIKRSYSICSSPMEKRRIEICVKRIIGGPGSSFLFELSDGDSIYFVGPIGGFTIKEESKMKDILFISTGTGIGPFRSMIPYLLEKGFSNKIILFAGYHSEEEILFDEEFKEMTKDYKNFNYKPIVSKPISQGYIGDKGYVQDLIKDHFLHDFKGDFYICGLSEMIKDVCSILSACGVESKRVYFDRYDWILVTYFNRPFLNLTLTR